MKSAIIIGCQHKQEHKPSMARVGKHQFADYNHSSVYGCQIITAKDGSRMPIFAQRTYIRPECQSLIESALICPECQFLPGVSSFCLIANFFPECPDLHKDWRVQPWEGASSPQLKICGVSLFGRVSFQELLSQKLNILKNYKLSVVTGSHGIFKEELVASCAQL